MKCNFVAPLGIAIDLLLTRLVSLISTSGQSEENISEA